MDRTTPEITRLLIAWYDTHRRPLPWRETRDPYPVWISEVILQQTRVAQGLDYYLRFMERFPRVEALAGAPLDEVLKMWQGLGYYSRARNLHAAARQIVERFGGRFPADYAALRSLPGVGDYTAAAIASIAFGLPHAVVDGNVYRVLARLYALDIPIDSGEGRRHFAALAQSLLDTDRAALSNQAMMEFGALQCTPGQPDCTACPAEELCLARRQGTVERLPVKRGKTEIKTRWFNYLVVRSGDKLLLSQRRGNDIWQGLYEFPLLESDRPLDFAELGARDDFARLFAGAGRVELLASRTMPPHQLSHRTIRASFHEIRIDAFTPTMLADYTAVTAAELGDYPIPRLMERYLEGPG